MNADQAATRLAEVVERKHLALNTEQSYCAWLRRYCQHITMLSCGPAQRTKTRTLSYRSGQNKYRRPHAEPSLIILPSNDCAIIRAGPSFPPLPPVQKSSRGLCVFRASAV